METIIFFILSGICVASAICMIALRHPIHSALSLVVCMVGIAGLFMLLNAHFLAVVQLAVYAGAVMVLVVFVIMLLNVGSTYEKYRSKILWGGVGLIVLPCFLGLFWSQFSGLELMPITYLEKVNEGTVEALGRVLFTKYLFTFELASVLILVALTGAVLIAKSNSKRPE